ncbi:MAG: hypothetical protein H8D97_00690 [Proteobacteria bacterium]|nr:hypothetical protein [Pseudomonadota bacterium]
MATNNILAPSNQTVYNTPLYQQSFKQDPKYGDSTAHPPDGSDPAVYLTRLLNLTLRAFGDDCIIKGSRVKINSGIGTNTIQFKVESGLFIKDTTLLELTEDVYVDLTADNRFDHYIISVHYDFSENIEDNPLEIHVSMWDSGDEEISTLPGQLVLAVFKYEMDGINVSRIEDVSLDYNTGLSRTEMTFRNVNLDPIGIGRVRPNPLPVKEMYRKLLESRDLHPNDILFAETWGIDEKEYQVPLYYVLGLPVFDKIEPMNTLLVELGHFGNY